MLKDSNHCDCSSISNLISHSKPSLSRKEADEVYKLIISGELAQGRKVEEFESEFEKFTGTKEAIAVNSGTSALHLSLLALGIKEGDEVIIPAFVCSALLNAVKYCNATPVLTDINSEDFNMDVKDVKKKISKKTKAVILPHMFGLPADLDTFIELDIPLIEDCAHSVGAHYKNRLVGTFGTISIFSFYATKMITTGEGGMIVTNSRKIADKIRDLREYDNKDFFTIRYNYKMTDIQAAIGICQLSRLQAFIERRKEIARIYTAALMDSGLRLPGVSEGKEHIFFRYIVVTEKEGLDNIIKNAEKRGICLRKPVYKPLSFFITESSCPVTGKIYNKALSIPIYPSLKEEAIDRIVCVLKDIIS